MMTIGGALSKFVGLFSDSFKMAIDSSLQSLDKMRDAMNELAETDKNKSFEDLFTDEMTQAANQNIARKENRQNWSSGKVDSLKEELALAEKLRANEKQSFNEEAKLNREKSQIKEPKKPQEEESQEEPKAKEKEDKKEKQKTNNHNDTYLASIGGGGNIATRFDTNEKQLTEAKKHSKLLEEIAENTANQSTSSELLMK